MNKNKYFDEIIKMLFGIEGGYVNDPDDMGGPTNYGITQDTFDAWQKINNQPRGSVKTDLTPKEAKDIYYTVDGHCEFKCSSCGKEILEIWSEQEFNYCPFCGAEMESEE